MNEQAAEARKEYQRQYRKQHRERIAEYRREWQRKNPEKVKAQQMRYWAKRAAAVGQTASMGDAKEV